MVKWLAGVNFPYQWVVEGQGQGHGNGQGHIRRGFRTLCGLAVGGGRGSHSDSRSLTVRGIYFDQTFIPPPPSPGLSSMFMVIFITKSQLFFFVFKFYCIQYILCYTLHTIYKRGVHILYFTGILPLQLLSSPLFIFIPKSFIVGEDC